ncbi:hypothetical protein BU24DRAFT_344912 [Aaosphaeria arxii CBS 175.79]|uniref:Xylanolytic transcriptional activator regulatory domain-containing protein n=1 Tax=Aaosphaeria arxii CBS 175.79 TaxID=1450172 RepID=A0A6A5XYY6_9PLEO|nr:uncharacterized protein BU24DRAFT_344912 [Aaosphaeria arxii CBS 175.79]KAF2017494.1 hypothetical protein BU24DRAFT_344912 [Aaosphaeria arxii CBS 175.79]
MDDSGPPCKRCAERNLSCVLNKSLQTLIEERSQWKTTVTTDLDHIHAALQEVLGRLSLPPLPPLQTTGGADYVPSPHDDGLEREDPGPSCDNSPRVSPRDDALPHVPIESLYQITRLRALRSDDTPDESQPTSTRTPNHPISDFISQGLVSIEDAERLVNFYLNRIDHFMYMVGSGRYRDLESLRRSSPILTAVICTVAALHDPNSNHLYGICSREFRRQMGAAMFDRRIDRDHIRAMCIGSYWLHDVSWTLSGYAIRRATEVNLSGMFQRALENNEEAMDCMRIWYTLYICDHHLSILYGRPSIVREDAAISGWEELMTRSVFTESDKRLVSQMALLIIMSNVRELFGPDTGEPVPRAFAPQLTNYSRQIDQWMGYWTTELMKLHQFIGEFPTKGVILHHHLAKLHLHSHVFRGLKGAPVPTYFQDSAIAAVAAATSIVEMLLTDFDIREALVGIPHYIHSMIAFACVFLLKIAAQHSGQYIEDARVLDMSNKVVQQFRSTAVGKWHLVHLMADGLEKMTLSKIKSPPVFHNPPVSNGMDQTGMQYVNEPSTTMSSMANGNGTGIFNGGMIANPFEEDLNLSTTPFLHFDSGNYDFNFSGF